MVLRDEDGLFRFETSDIEEAFKMQKAAEMADAITDLKMNLWRQWKEDESLLTVASMSEAIYKMLAKHGVEFVPWDESKK